MKHRKKKKGLKNEQELNEMWDNIKLFNICVIVVPERGRRQKNS